MSEYNLIYKFKAPEGYYGCKCRVLSHGQGDRVLLGFEDGRKLMRSKFSVTSEAKFNAAQFKVKAETIPCPHCNGKGKVLKPQLPLVTTGEIF